MKRIPRKYDRRRGKKPPDAARKARLLARPRDSKGRIVKAGAAPIQAPTPRNPQEVMQGITEGTLEVSTVTAAERRLAIADLMLRGYTPSQMAAIFKVSLGMISIDKRKVREAAGEMTTELDTRKEVGIFCERMEYIYSQAIREKDYRLAKDIADTVLDRLAKFGFLQPVGPVPQTLRGMFIKQQKEIKQEQPDGTPSTVTDTGTEATTLGSFEVTNLTDSQLEILERILSGRDTPGALPSINKAVL